jgi:hypothetical protein
MKPDRAYKRDLHPPLRHDHQTSKVTQRRPLIANSAIIRGQRRRMNPSSTALAELEQDRRHRASRYRRRDRRPMWRRCGGRGQAATAFRPAPA